MSKKKVLILDVVIMCLLIVLDQISKMWIVNHLMGHEPIVWIENVFELRYLENFGAAFGMFQNGKAFFLAAAVIMVLIISFILVKAPNEKKYIPWHVFLTLIAAGGLGNMIDRIRINYVIDFFYFKLINFPIFNVADIYVSIGTVLLIIFVLFVCKEDDLSFISFKKKG